MKSLARTFAERGIQMLETALQKRPPTGVRPEFVAGFFGMYREVLIVELTALLEEDAKAQEETGVEQAADEETRFEQAADEAAAQYDALRAQDEEAPTWTRVAEHIRQAFPGGLYPVELPLLLDQVTTQGARLTPAGREKLLHLDGAGLLGALSMLHSDIEAPPWQTLEQYLQDAVAPAPAPISTNLIH